MSPVLITGCIILFWLGLRFFRFFQSAYEKLQKKLSFIFLNTSGKMIIYLHLDENEII